MIEMLEEQGYQIRKAPPKERASVRILEREAKPGGTVRIALVSDTHLGSTWQQLTALQDFYRYADGKGVQAFLHAGDFLDGLHVHRDAVYGQFAHGFDAQLGYAAEVYPKSANGPTYAIEGNHDLWYFGNAGATAVQWLTAKRPDISYLGEYSAFVEVGPLRIYIAHGAKGGGSYGKSYKVQRLIEQLEVEQRDQTQLAFFGHWHSDLYLGRYQGVFTWMLPCFQSQTRFLRTIGKSPTIGGLILEIEFTRDRKVWNVRQDWKYYEARIGDYPGGDRDHRR